MYAMYYVSTLWCWQLIRILVRTNHPCSRVGCHMAATWRGQATIGTVWGEPMHAHRDDSTKVVNAADDDVG
jgi:hypothetical protein